LSGPRRNGERACRLDVDAVTRKDKQVMTSFAAPRARRRALLAGAVAVAAALGAGAMSAPSAHAAFTLNACEGTTFVAQGSSFQRSMQASMKTLFESSFGCNGAIAGPTYNPNGSGNGNAAMGAGVGNATLNCAPGCPNNPAPVGQRDPTTRLSGTDEPPNPTQQARINDAATPSTADDGKIHVIPVAAGASVLIVHAPQGCDLSTVTNLTNGANGTVNGVDTGDRASDHTQRIRFTSEMVEKIFAADSDADTWGEIAPGISGTGSDPAEPLVNNVACGSIPVRRIVRFDNSGTTYSWKAYLELIDPGRGRLTTYNPNPNTVWPKAGGTDSTTPQAAVGPACNNADHLCSATTNGAGPLTTAVSQTDGSIGYSDLATARTGNFTIVSGGTQDYTFWSPLQNNPGGAATGYAEPTFTPTSHTDRVVTPGANCQNVSVQNVPSAGSSPGGDPTQGDWSRAFAAGGASYPACVLTYLLAWDDNAPVYGNTAAEQGAARSVKDYLEKIIVSGVGQGALFGADYSALPPGLLAISQNAVNAIGWNKAAGSGGGGGGGGGGGTTTPPRGGTGGGGTATPPSNQFSLPSASTSARGLLYTVQLPGAGVLSVVATARAGRRTIRVGSLSVRASASGRVRVKLSLSAAARRALARARGHKLKITVKFTFTPNGGSARTVTKTVTVRAAARRGHRRGGRR
jgi:hypothetical protein